MKVATKKEDKISERERAALELRLIEQAIADLQVRIATLDNAIEEHENALSLIEELSKLNDVANVLIPIGGGNFIAGQIPKLNKINVSVGAGVVIEKTLEEGKEIITQRKNSIEKLRTNYQQRIREYLARASEIRASLERE